MEKHFFAVRVSKHGNRSPRDVVKSQSLDIIQSLDRSKLFAHGPEQHVLGDLLEQVDWIKVHHSVILLKS